MAVLNEKRGTTSTGIFDGNGASYKAAQCAREFLRDSEAIGFLEAGVVSGALCGHTRQPTRGGPSTKNAHPFHYGDIVGAHNGCLFNAPMTYDVDSMYAFDLLSKQEPGAYQKALGELTGSYVLTWRDNRNETLYFLNWRGNIHFVDMGGGLWYYSSESGDLITATGAGKEKIQHIKEGGVIEWSGGRISGGGFFKGPEPAQWLGHNDDPDEDYIPGGGRRRRSYQNFTTIYDEMTGQARRFDDGWYAEIKGGKGEYLRVGEYTEEAIEKEFPNMIITAICWPKSKGVNMVIRHPKHRRWLPQSDVAWLVVKEMKARTRLRYLKEVLRLTDPQAMDVLEKEHLHHYLLKSKK